MKKSDPPELDLVPASARRAKALHWDGAIGWLVDAVCCRGETLMGLTTSDKHTATKLEHKLLAACRLLATEHSILG